MFCTNYFKEFIKLQCTFQFEEKLFRLTHNLISVIPEKLFTSRHWPSMHEIVDGREMEIKKSHL